MTLRVINNGTESFRETLNRVVINGQNRTVYSHRIKGEHKEFIVFFLLSEMLGNKQRFMVVKDSDLIKPKKEKK